MPHGVIDAGRVDGFLFRRMTVPGGVEAVISFLYGKELGDIYLHICPFCGKRFSSKSALAIHLKRDKNCSIAYWSMCKDVVECYRKVREVVFRSNRGYCVDVPELEIRECFTNTREAFEFVLEVGLVEC